MNNPLISVIIPCYNVELFVEQAVRSIMEQTYQNLEIICINDCSKDNTSKILQKLAKEDNRIVYVENEKNLKLVGSLNKGICLAQGEYIARMDGDDISVLDRLEKQMNFMLDNPTIDIVGTNVCEMDEKGVVLEAKRTYRNLSHNEIVVQLPYKCSMGHATILAKKSFFVDVGQYQDMPYAEDYEYWIRAWLYGKKFANISDVTYYYRMHSNQMSGIGFNHKNAKVIRDMIWFYFKKTKNIKFLLGIISHTKIVSLLIVKTYHIRKIFK